MSSLPSFDTKNEPQISRSVEKFFKDYKVMELLRRCGLRKSKGIPLWSVLSYIFSNVFRDRSMYMQQKSGKCTAGFSKNTYYRFMQNPHINWLRLTILLAERIVNGHLKDLTSDQRADCFVFDDSLYSKTGYKKTELTAKVFDHVSMTYKKGFRMMTMGWTDGSSFVPIASSLLSSKNDQNVIGTTKKIDKRTIKGDHVVIQLLDQALKAGLTAKYVMFDTWFSNRLVPSVLPASPSSTLSWLPWAPAACTTSNCLKTAGLLLPKSPTTTWALSGKTSWRPWLPSPTCPRPSAW
ncbi:transposase [Lactobacillus delbrueckii subsp. bulgaricus]|nr:transposase [Lactobacillus delbrueckii subsp. bulgaricus]